MNSLQRVGLAALGAAFLLSIPASLAAQPYVFTKIADTVTHPAVGLHSVGCVGMNKHGSVVIVGYGSTLWEGSAGALTMVAPEIGSPCPSINDLGEIAYVRIHYPSLNVHSLVRNTGGIETIIARSDQPPYLDASTNTSLVSLNLTGSAVHHTSIGPGFGRGIHIAPAGTKVYNEATDPPLGFFSASNINDSDSVVFLGSAAGVLGVYRGGPVPLLQSGDVVSGGVIQVQMFRPQINNGGRVAFVGTLTVGGSIQPVSTPRTRATHSRVSVWFRSIGSH
jgi:hypothetical protein